MKIDGINDGLNAQNLPPKKQDVQKPEEGKAPATDKLELSNAARQLNHDDQLLNIAKAQLGAVAEVRQEKIEEVQGKLASHYYDQKQVISDIAGKMMKSQALADAVARDNSEAAQANEEALKKLAVVFNRMDRGIYDTEPVLKAVASKLKTYLSADRPD